jgi:superfamily I DNA/RNA helicase
VIVPEITDIFLSTALRVKGQEFDKVIILDTIDGIWPMHKKKETKQDDDIVVLDDIKLSDCVLYDFVNRELMPIQNINSDSDDIESERRLFYVAVTRPKKKLHFYRTTNIDNKQISELSPFIKEGKYNI